MHLYGEDDEILKMEDDEDDEMEEGMMMKGDVAAGG